MQFRLVVHAGLVVLLIATALAVFKPWGVTRYGMRKQHEERGKCAAGMTNMDNKRTSGRTSCPDKMTFL